MVLCMKLVLIPLLVDVPLWVAEEQGHRGIQSVLIPLLVDVPLWVLNKMYLSCVIICLNPSFSGCPALGFASTN